MNLGLFMPLALVAGAILATIFILPTIRRLETSDVTSPAEPDAANRARLLKIVLAVEWLLPLFIYFVLNVLTDVGTMPVF